MGSELGRALRSLCCGGGWCYCVLWRFDRRDPRSLKMEESYCEEKCEGVVEHLRSQIHIVGEGTIGRIAISGKHQWISDAYCMDGTNNCSTILQTIVIISLPSLGVIQFGSSQKISENLEFIKQVRHTFQQRNIVLPDGDVDKGMKIHNFDESFAAVISTGSSSIWSQNNDTYNNSCKRHVIDMLTSAAMTQNPCLAPLEFHHGARSCKHKLNSHVTAMPLISSSFYTPQGFGSLFPKVSPSTESSLHLKTQIQAASTRAQGVLPPDYQLSHGSVQSRSSFSSTYSAATQLDSNARNMEAALPKVEERMLSGMRAQGFSGIASHIDANEDFCGNSITYHGSLALLSKPFDLSSSEISETNRYRAGTSPELGHFSSSSFLVTKGDPSGGKSFSEVPFLDPELPNRSLNFLQGSMPEHTKLVQLEGVLSDSFTVVRPSEQGSESPTTAMNCNPPGCLSASSAFIRNTAIVCNPSTDLPGSLVQNKIEGVLDSSENGHNEGENSSYLPTHQTPDNDLFDGIELDLNPSILGQEFWDDILISGSENCSKLSGGVSDCITELEMVSTETAENQVFSGSGGEELLNAVVGGNDSLSRNHISLANGIDSVTSSGLEHKFSAGMRVGGAQAYRSDVPLVTHPCFSQSLDMLFPEGERNDSSKDAPPKSEVPAWVAGTQSRNLENVVVSQPKRPEEAAKVLKKRARPGESTRPRPKDRQQIQDRVKELRDIVPNGAKCSIDALLDRTIKHMLYLQSVTKYADKLKQADEPKIIGQESGVVLKDNSSGDGGGATWAFEVAGQTMVCPIIVEDLNPPGQMLVEMLCEERGFFLEIADIIRGFGLIILKGVMEVRDRKIWARFLVEANRDVTRMDIFLSLVQLLQQTSFGLRTSEQPKKLVDCGFPAFTNYQQSPMRIPISLADTLK